MLQTTYYICYKLHTGNSKACPICPFTAPPTTQVISDFNGYKYVIKDQVNCQSKNVIYRWGCKKTNCKDHPKNSYIRKTTQTLQKRFSQHRDYIKRNIITEPSGEHFTLPGHSVSDIEGLVIEKVIFLLLDFHIDVTQTHNSIPVSLIFKTSSHLPK